MCMTECQAEQSCYDDVAGCISDAEKLAPLFECLVTLETCLLNADTCHNEYLGCAMGCTDEACLESCVVGYSKCFDSCGWDYSCVGDCDSVMEECGEGCGDFEFDCWFDCYTDAYGTCMEKCF